MMDSLLRIVSSFYTPSAPTCSKGSLDISQPCGTNTMVHY
jgi:hypothetical protein